MAYAVVRENEGDAYHYDVADVVVFETDAYADHNTYFVYENNNWYSEYVWGIGYDENGEIANDKIYVDEWIGSWDEIKFYDIDEDGVMTPIDANYDDDNIYAGNVNVLYDVTGRDYFQVYGTAAGNLHFNPNEIDIYKVTMDGADYDAVVVKDWDEVDYDDRMILFTDSKENVEYAIWVEASVDDDDVIIGAVAQLWSDIHNYRDLTWEEKAEAVIGTGLTNATIGAAEYLLGQVENVIATTESVSELNDAAAAKVLLDAAIEAYYKALLDSYVADPELTAAQKAEAGYAAEVAAEKANVTDKTTYGTACDNLDAFCQAYIDELTAAQAAAKTALTNKADDLKSSYKDMATAINATLAAETAKVDAATTKAAVTAAQTAGIAALEAAVEDEATNDQKNLVDAAAAIVNATNWANESVAAADQTEAAWEAAVKAAVEEKVSNVDVEVAAKDWSDPAEDDEDGSVDVTFTVTLSVDGKAAKDVEITLTITDGDKVKAIEKAAELEENSALAFDMGIAANAANPAEVTRRITEEGYSSAASGYTYKVNCTDAFTAAEMADKSADIEYTVTVTYNGKTATTGVLHATVTGTWS